MNTPLSHFFCYTLVLSTTILCGCDRAVDASAEVSTHALDASFKTIELDPFIKQEVKTVAKFEGKKLIKMAVPVRFVATVKQEPREKEASYIYTALEIAKVVPLPNVDHQMFIETAEKKIISVYVEHHVAQRFLTETQPGDSLQFSAYHVYSFAKGPALLVTDFALNAQ